MLGLEPVHPRHLIRTLDLGLGLLRQRHESTRRAARAISSASPLSCSFSRGVLVDGLQHHEPGLFIRSFLLPEQALVKQRGDARRRRPRAGRPRRRTPPLWLPACDHRRTRRAWRTGSARPRRVSRLWLHSMVSLKVRCLSGRLRAPTGEELEAVAEPGEHRLGWQAALMRAAASSMARGRPSRTPAQNLGHGGGVLVGDGEVGLDGLGALDEQAHRLVVRHLLQEGRGPRRRQGGQPQRRHGELVLSVDASAPHGWSPGLSGEEPPTSIPSRNGDRLQHLLEVVQQEEHLPVAQIFLEPLLQRSVPDLRHAQRPSDGRGRRVRGRLWWRAARRTRRPRTLRSAPQPPAIPARVLPVPPGPMSVSRRTSGLRSRSQTAATSRSRPTSGVGWAGRLLR